MVRIGHSAGSGMRDANMQEDRFIGRAACMFDFRHASSLLLWI